MDTHIDHVQSLLSISHPALDGLQSTCLSEPSGCQFTGTPNGPFVQIMNLAGNHWICVSNVECLVGHVNVFDSIYSGRTTKLMKQQIVWLLYSSDESITLAWPNIKQQTGSSDCGLFAIANATVICSGVDPTSQDWDQPEMRQHLVKCFQAGYIEMFPTATAAKPNQDGGNNGGSGNLLQM